MKCVIFGAAPADDYAYIRELLPASGRLVIAADGGLRYTAALGLEPDIIIGDMDSVRREDVPPGAILYPSTKTTLT
mgnify:FL=1